MADIQSSTQEKTDSSLVDPSQRFRVGDSVLVINSAGNPAERVIQGRMGSKYFLVKANPQSFNAGVVEMEMYLCEAIVRWNPCE